jgi:excisionase family DNA binding protein
VENLLNVNQIAFILKVHPLTVRRYIRENRLKAVKAGGNVRIRESDLNSFTKAFSVTTKHPANPIEKQSNISKSFTADDPLLRMEGRGASLIVR